MAEPELTYEAKALIRRYMVSLITLPGILVTVLAFVIGFLINDVAKGKAANDAYENVQQIIINLALGVKDASQDAETNRQHLVETSNKITNILKEAQQTLNSLQSSKAFEQSSASVKELVDQLVKDERFLSAISSSFPAEGGAPQSEGGASQLEGGASKFQFGVATVSFENSFGVYEKVGKVSFPKEFASKPIVFLVEYDASGDWIFFKTNQVTSKGFEWAGYRIVAQLNGYLGPYKTKLAWIAVSTKG